jgi:hypothetical protein
MSNFSTSLLIASLQAPYIVKTIPVTIGNKDDADRVANDLIPNNPNRSGNRCYIVSTNFPRNECLWAEVQCADDCYTIKSLGIKKGIDEAGALHSLLNHLKTALAHKTIKVTLPNQPRLISLLTDYGFRFNADDKGTYLPKQYIPKKQLPELETMREKLEAMRETLEAITGVSWKVCERYTDEHGAIHYTPLEYLHYDAAWISPHQFAFISNAYIEKSDSHHLPDLLGVTDISCASNLKNYRWHHETTIKPNQEEINDFLNQAGSTFNAVSGNGGESPLLSRRCAWGSTGGCV